MFAFVHKIGDRNYYKSDVYYDFLEAAQGVKNYIEEIKLFGRMVGFIEIVEIDYYRRTKVIEIIKL